MSQEKKITRVNVPLITIEDSSGLDDMRNYPKDFKYGFVELLNDSTSLVFAYLCQGAMGYVYIGHTEGTRALLRDSVDEEVKQTTNVSISEDTLLKAMAIAQDPTLIKEIFK